MPKIKIIILAVLLTSCGSGGRKQSEKLKKLVKAGEYNNAETYVNSEKFFPEKESRLLKLVELGTIQYLNRHYYQALKSFDKAKDLSDKLFTVSISKKAVSAVTNSNYDNYYGEKFERSMIRYYQSLTHFALSQNGEYEAHELIKRDKEGKVVGKKVVPLKKLTAKEKRFHLSGAKNVLVEWNSLLDNYKATTGGTVAYKDDLLAKVFGAFIHEQMGSKQERRVALNLYKAAKEVLFRNFNALETYNNKSKEFKKDFKKLPNMPLSKVKANYVAETEHAKNLLKFLDKKIQSLKKGKRSNLFVMIENGFITPKKVKKFDFPIPLTGIPNVGGFVGFAGTALSMAAGAAPKIYFELPEIPYEAVKGTYILHVQKDGKTIKKQSLAVVNPLANLATMLMDENSTSMYAKVGARVAGKHLTALLAAYATSKKMGNLAGSLAYGVANKAIEASERADLRNWSLLPHHYRLASLSLKPGTYDLVLEKILGETRTQTKLNTVTVKAKDVNMLAFRTY
jgi:hypothetical protein